jgi:P63C domain
VLPTLAGAFDCLNIEYLLGKVNGQVLTFLLGKSTFGIMAELDSESAKQLSKLGASKGGRARASVLTPDERRRIAREAISVRWAKYREQTLPPSVIRNVLPPKDEQKPFSMFTGTVHIGDMDIEAHVLSDEKRVFTQREVVRVLSGGRESGNLGSYLKRNPLFKNQLSAGATIEFRIPGNPVLATGYEATLLVEICELYLEARRQKLLKPSQFKLAMQSEIILRSSAKIGIIALIDEATGYQEVRKKRALQVKFQAFIAEEMQEWARMFDSEFWIELARLEGVRYSPRNRPLRWGKYITAFVYDAIDKDISKALKAIIPDPHYQNNLHQLLTDWGRQQVHDQIQKVTTIMKLCRDMKDFREKFDHVFKKTALQLNFMDIWESHQ